MKVSELKTATCAIELPRTYTRDEAIQLAESWGLIMSKAESRFIAHKYKYILIENGFYAGSYDFLSSFFKKHTIKLSDIEP